MLGEMRIAMWVSLLFGARDVRQARMDIVANNGRKKRRDQPKGVLPSWTRKRGRIDLDQHHSMIESQKKQARGKTASSTC
jgi:hypothetical protein